MSTKHEVAVELAGGKRLVFETGRMAKQASGAALVTTGETVVLATAVASPRPPRGHRFLPPHRRLPRVHLRWRTHPRRLHQARGRPSEKEVLTCRQIDRPIRPLFPRWLPQRDAGPSRWSSPPTRKTTLTWLASTPPPPPLRSLTFPSAPPSAAVRIGRVEGEFVIKPRPTPSAPFPTVNIMVVGHKDGIVMIEGRREGRGRRCHSRSHRVRPRRDQEESSPPLTIWSSSTASPSAPSNRSRVRRGLLRRAEVEDRRPPRGCARTPRAHAKTESYALVKKIKDDLAAELPADDPTARRSSGTYYEALRERLFPRAGDEGAASVPTAAPSTRFAPISIETSVLPRTHGSGALHPRRDAGSCYGHARHR